MKRLTCAIQYRYYVAYFFNAKGGSGHGGIEITRSQAIRCFEDVQQMRSLIEQTNKWKPRSVVILNWILL